MKKFAITAALAASFAVSACATNPYGYNDRYYNGQYDTYEDRQDRDSWWDRIFGG